MKYNLDYEEMKQLEEWTSLKCTDVLFDSFTDNWSENITDFDERINGKKQILFLIEDEDREKFGYYLNTKVENYFDGMLK